MTLITGSERRRRWSADDKARILAEIEEPSAVVAEVARRADVCTSLVYKWRREARKTASVCGFAPVVVETPPPVSAALRAASAPDPWVVVVEVKDARVQIGADAPSAVIAATLKALRS